MKYILILNGPNLNLLGRREPDIYGTATLSDIISSLEDAFPQTALRHIQSNHEGALIDAIHQHGFEPDCLGIVLNAGAFTHYSYAIADAIAAVSTPVVEVHMSNVHAREEFRRRSVIAPVCRGSISGFGADSYRLAVEALLRF
ncbi:MAG: type II 3-dehydroquinate dehydratase [Muribaculaceae bacterium]|nr:type II 3-dehydroquinate dehydratase [Muribaculaceae bacterium]